MRNQHCSLRISLQFNQPPNLQGSLQCSRLINLPHIPATSLANGHHINRFCCRLTCPSHQPSMQPTIKTTQMPSRQPISNPSVQPTQCLILKPSVHPTSQPSVKSASIFSNFATFLWTSFQSERPTVPISNDTTMAATIRNTGFQA